MNVHPWKPWRLTAADVKDRVSHWAMGCGYWPIEEIGGVVDGRIDVLLVPIDMTCAMFRGMPGVHWTERLGLAGVEVKVDKSDYKNGANGGQFERYESTLAGLYIAGPPDVVVAKNVPANFGVLTLGARPTKPDELPHIVCRRHPKWQRRALDNESMWRFVWAIGKEAARDRRERREVAEQFESRIKDHAGRAIWAAVREAAKKAEQLELGSGAERG